MRSARRALPLAMIMALSGCLGGVDGDSASDDAVRVKGAAVPLSSVDDIEAMLSQPTYKEIERIEGVVTSHDGTELWLDVFKPATDEAFPTILVMTPYQALGATLSGSMGQEPYSPSVVEFFAPRGYAVAFADVRGYNNSGGCENHSGSDQWKDGVAIIAWIRSQGWSDGLVGMHGISYDGETQISTATQAPEGLVTIVPVASIASLYDYIFYDGVPFTNAALTNHGAYSAISFTPGTDPMVVTRYPGRFTCQLEHLQAVADDSGDYTAYWADRDFRPNAQNVKASVLMVHGLQDWNVKMNSIDVWDSFPGEKRLILGQWTHAYPDRPDWPLILHRWYDHYLKSIDTGILDDLPPVLVEDDTGLWRGLPSFTALQDQPMLELFPATDGTLRSEPAADASISVRDAPPFDDEGSTILEFVSEPLERPIRLTGRPLVFLSASTEAVSTHWAVQLVEIAQGGPTFVTNRGYLDTRHIDGIDQPKDLTPGQRYDAVLRMFPQDDLIESGNQIRIVISTQEDWIEQDRTYAMSTLFLGQDGLRIVLPIDPGGAPIPDDKLREGL